MLGYPGVCECVCVCARACVCARVHAYSRYLERNGMRADEKRDGDQNRSITRELWMDGSQSNATISTHKWHPLPPLHVYMT